MVMVLMGVPVSFRPEPPLLVALLLVPLLPEAAAVGLGAMLLLLEPHADSSIAATAITRTRARPRRRRRPTIPRMVMRVFPSNSSRQYTAKPADGPPLSGGKTDFLNAFPWRERYLLRRPRPDDSVRDRSGVVIEQSLGLNPDTPFFSTVQNLTYVRVAPE